MAGPGGTTPRILRAGLKDPSILNNQRPYAPTRQMDELLLAQKRAASIGNTIPMSEAIEIASQTPAAQSRIQADYTQYLFQGKVLDANPRILIPRNLNRSNWYVINNTVAKTIYVTFGPVATQLTPVIGFPVLPGTWMGETNGVISINDIYIHSDVSASTFVVLGYEGIPPLVSS